MKLKNKSGVLLQLNNKEKTMLLIEELKIAHENNPTKDVADKVHSLLATETFSTLFTEGEVSSRRDIKKTFKQDSSSKQMNASEAKIDDFLGAYKYAMTPKEFSINNIFTLYSLVSQHGLDPEDKLNDGELFRSDAVYISSRNIKQEFAGFSPENIKEALIDLSEYLNNSDDDIYLKAVIGHIYFEIIHPYYDYNGRTGRFIPMWLFSNEGRLKEMMYFATAVAHYREKYISIFRKNIDPRTNKVDLSHMVNSIVKLLILNQKQYTWLKTLENKYINSSNKSFSDLQKSFLWTIMIKLENSNNADSWCKITDADKSFIELHLKSSLFSKDTKLLEAHNIIQISSDKPRKYKLNNYELFSK